MAQPITPAGLGVTLLADANRDGRIDVSDATLCRDFSWTQGALFLFNCDSDEASGQPDCDDERVNGEADLKDLAAIHLLLPNAPQAGTKLTLAVDSAARPHVRVFARRPGTSTAPLAADYQPVSLNTSGNLDPAGAVNGVLELRIEARQFADAQWNGLADLTVAITPPEGGPESQYALRMRVAPFLLLSNLAKGQTLYVREYPAQNDKMIEQLRQAIPQTGADLHIIPGDAPYRPNHIWIQDAMEVGYTEMPGVRMNVVLPANRDKSLDAFPKDKLLGPDFGWFRCGEFRPTFGAGEGDYSWLDWFGNLEVTPPWPGQPLGRVIYGQAGEGKSLNPQIVSLLAAQEIQAPPIPFDVQWLLIKHVDEIMCFLPPKSADRPFLVLVPDPDSMLSLAQKWVDNGHGDLPFLERYEKTMTVRKFVNDADLVLHNATLQRERIEPIIAQIKAEFGLGDDDILRIPAWFEKDGRSKVPNMVNSAVVNGNLLVSEPAGPVVNGKDLLEEHFRQLLAGVPVQIHFFDDWRYHTWCGNMHCATNVRRADAPAPFWTRLSP